MAEFAEPADFLPDFSPAARHRSIERGRESMYCRISCLSLLAAFVLGCGGAGEPGAAAEGGMGVAQAGGNGGGSTVGSAGTGGATAGESGIVQLPPGEADPGRVTAHRLNAREYDNTIRDLVGLDLKPSAQFEFPADEWGDGFDNDADVLTVSPLSVEKYLAAAQSVIAQALDPANAVARQGILVCDPSDAANATCVDQILGAFARRAFRHPIEAGELVPYLTLVDLALTHGDDVERGLNNALAAMLVAPDFLYRIEPDPQADVIRALNGFELASRLSYFIWASMPDEELFAAAEQGALSTPDQIAAQVQRMLADAKSSAFLDVLVKQWMHTVELDFAEPDVRVFPSWQPSLEVSMEQETRAFLAPILAGEAPATDLLTANYSFVNQALAQYYGLPDATQIPADQFVRVTLPDARRGGVLRQGSFLVLTSHPDTHSPTRRGKWILDRLLCRKPPPPPPDVPAFDPNVSSDGTLRQKLESLHQGAASSCAACHALIDPMGFALENYDGVGLWRDLDNGQPVDASGTMPETGVSFNGAAELSAAIAADPRFASCVSQQLLTYALGRHTTAADRSAIDALGQGFANGGYNLANLVTSVATSNAMTLRHSEAAAP
jgi:hypothetical protein